MYFLVMRPGRFDLPSPLTPMVCVCVWSDVYVHTYIHVCGVCTSTYVVGEGRGSDVVCGGYLHTGKLSTLGGLKFPLPPSPSDETLICV